MMKSSQLTRPWRKQTRVHTLQDWTVQLLLSAFNGIGVENGRAWAVFTHTYFLFDDGQENVTSDE